MQIRLYQACDDPDDVTYASRVVMLPFNDGVFCNGLTIFFIKSVKCAIKAIAISLIYSIFANKLQKVIHMGRDINRLKVVLAEKKRTNKWLAEQLGKDPGTVSKWCTNKMQPNLETLVKIAECLGVNAKDLLW